MLSRTLSFLLCSLSVWSSLNAQDAATPVTVFLNGADGYNIYRIPALIQTADGQLLAFCEARAGGDASEIDLVLKRSRDGGRHWQPLEVVQDSADFRAYFDQAPPAITVGNPAPVVDLLCPEHPGRIWLPFTLENDRVFVTFSDDSGSTWSAPREITDAVKLEPWGWYATGPVHSIQLQGGPYRGRLVVPADHRIGPDGADSGAEGAHVIFSHDHGQTWQLGAVDATYADDFKANETTVVELNDGRLYFNSRDQNGAAAGTRGGALSSDGGSSFDPSGNPSYRWFVPLTSVLDLPVVQGSLMRAASTLEGDAQDLLVLSGPDESGPSGKGRSDLRLRLSTDEAASWQDGPLIHVGPAAYSDMVRLNRQQLGILYEAGTKGTKSYDRIDFVAWPIDSLLQQGLVSPTGDAPR